MPRVTQCDYNSIDTEHSGNILITNIKTILSSMDLGLNTSQILSLYNDSIGESRESYVNYNDWCANAVFKIDQYINRET